MRAPIFLAGNVKLTRENLPKFGGERQLSLGECCNSECTLEVVEVFCRVSEHVVSKHEA